MADRLDPALLELRRLVLIIPLPDHGHMAAPSLSTQQRQAALRLGADGRRAEVLTLLADWSADVEKSPQLSLAYGTAYARLGRTRRACDGWTTRSPARAAPATVRSNGAR